MIFLVFDSDGILRSITDNWPRARSALDMLVQIDVGCPRLEIHASADYLLED